MPVGQSRVGFRYSGFDLPRGGDAKDGGEIGRAAALAGLPQLFVRRNRPTGERIGHSKQPDQVPFRKSSLRYVPGGSFNHGATQTDAGAIIERRCCINGIAIVISPPAPTSRAGESNVGEEIRRIDTSIAAPLRCSPADVAEHA